VEVVEVSDETEQWYESAEYAAWCDRWVLRQEAPTADEAKPVLEQAEDWRLWTAECADLNDWLSLA
jgi:hypothetical protein